jgi:hypothetical protein
MEDDAPPCAVFGADIVEILEAARRQGRRVAAPPSPKCFSTQGMSYDEVKQCHQISLDDEANLLDGLEDQDLKEHMSNARAEFADFEKKRAELPAADLLDKSGKDAKRDLSLVMTGLEEQLMTLRCATEEVLRYSGDVQKIAQVTKTAPHGDTIAHLRKKIAATGGDMERVVSELDKLVRALTVARRAFEITTDGLNRRCDHFRAAYDAAIAMNQCLADACRRPPRLPSDEPLSDKPPSAEASSAKPPSAKPPSDESPSDESSSAEPPSDKAPTGEPSSDKAPSGEPSSDKAPSDEPPSGETDA